MFAACPRPRRSRGSDFWRFRLVELSGKLGLEAGGSWTVGRWFGVVGSVWPLLRMRCLIRGLLDFKNVVG